MESRSLPPQQTTKQIKEKLLQMVGCSKGDEIIDEINKIFLDESLSNGQKIVLIGNRKDIFKLGEKHIKDGVVNISFDKKKYIFPEWKITSIVNCCKEHLKELKRKQDNEAFAPKPNKVKSSPPEIDTLEKAFKEVSKFKKVMEILVKNEYCQPSTYNWKDESKSNKGTVIFLLKYLHAQNYYKDNKKLKPKEIKLIAQNSFGIKISESYIKQCKTEDPEIKKIIPPASTI